MLITEKIKRNVYTVVWYVLAVLVGIFVTWVGILAFVSDGQFDWKVQFPTWIMVWFAITGGYIARGWEKHTIGLEIKDMDEVEAQQWINLLKRHIEAVK